MYTLVIWSAAIGLIPLAFGLVLDLANSLNHRLDAAVRAALLPARR